MLADSTVGGQCHEIVTGRPLLVPVINETSLSIT